MGTSPRELSAFTRAHILFVTFTGQGHLNPFLRFAKSVASKGADVTFSTIADAGHRIRQAIKSSSTAADCATAADGAFTPLGAGRIRFEFFSDGWEVGDPRRYDLDIYMPQLKTVGSKEVEELIKRQEDFGRPVACVVGNPFIPWVLDVAGAMAIPRAILWVQSAAVFSAYFHYHRELTEFPTVLGQEISVHLPGVPPLDSHEVPSFLVPGNPYPSLTTAILTQFSNVQEADWVFVNTFEEIESAAIEGLAPHLRLIPVGPLVDPPTKGGVRGDLWKAADCEGWLDKRPPGSVVYVSVGSIVVLSAAEIVEMAEGLRASGQPFLWVVREDARAMLPVGFEEDVSDRGMIVQWSPQEAVLRHPSTACFLTHCGWNSTLECLTSGVPAVAFPQWGDQVTDAKFLVEVFQMGVHLRPQPPTSGPHEGPSFSREHVQRAIEEVIRGPRAEEMRANAAKVKDLATSAVTAEGSTDRNIKAFVEQVTTLRAVPSAGKIKAESYESITPELVA